MVQYSNQTKTVLVAFQNSSEIDSISRILDSEHYRIIQASNFLSLIESFERYRIHLIISEVDLPGISMITLLPFLRKRHPDLKVIVAMKDYSPEKELILRPYKILYVLTWPLNAALLKSLVSRGLEIYKKERITVKI